METRDKHTGRFLKGYGKGIPKSESTKAKARKALKGRKPGFSKRSHSKETKEKIRTAALTRYKDPAERLRTGLLLRGRMLSIPHRNNISKAAEKRTGEKNAMYGRKHTQSSKNIIRAKRIARVFPNKQTSIEIAMHRALEGLGAAHFEANKPLENICQPDIFIPPNIVVFCDGDYWHKRPKTMEIDLRITKALIKRGYRVFRFWESDINIDAQKCARMVLEKHDNFEEWALRGEGMKVYYDNEAPVTPAPIGGA